jgi:hypothetical protein
MRVAHRKGVRAGYGDLTLRIRIHTGAGVRHRWERSACLERGCRDVVLASERSVRAFARRPFSSSSVPDPFSACTSATRSLICSLASATNHWTS